jgi:tetratricopeptide (TPR) repeat protein
MQRLLIVAVLAIPLGASADPKSDARAHVAKATELHKQNKFAEALGELTTAYALDPQPQLLYAMGQLHVQLGECDQAIAFYERFLASHPDEDVAGATREAIDTCKKNPPPAPTPEHVEPPPPQPQPQPQPQPPPIATHDERPWYGDWIADGLVAGGVVSGVVAIAMYRNATSARDDADHAATYDAYAKLVDTAKTDRTYAIVFGVAGAALIAGGATHFFLTRSTAADMAIVPTHGGAAVGIAGRF